MNPALAVQYHSCWMMAVSTKPPRWLCPWWLKHCYTHATATFRSTKALFCGLWYWNCVRTYDSFHFLFWRKLKRIVWLLCEECSRLLNPQSILFDLFHRARCCTGGFPEIARIWSAAQRAGELFGSLCWVDILSAAHLVHCKCIRKAVPPFYFGPYNHEASGQ